MKSIGQLLDTYLADYPEYETVFIYHDKKAKPHIVITSTERDYEWADVFSEDIDLKEEIENRKKELAALNSKINAKQREYKSIENAIKKLAKYQS